MRSPLAIAGGKKPRKKQTQEERKEAKRLTEGRRRKRLRDEGVPTPAKKVASLEGELKKAKQIISEAMQKQLKDVRNNAATADGKHAKQMDELKKEVCHRESLSVDIQLTLTSCSLLPHLHVMILYSSSMYTAPPIHHSLPPPATQTILGTRAQAV
jgi:hypothetical protein